MMMYIVRNIADKNIVLMQVLSKQQQTYHYNWVVKLLNPHYIISKENSHTMLVFR